VIEVTCPLFSAYIWLDTGSQSHSKRKRQSVGEGAPLVTKYQKIQPATEDPVGEFSVGQSKYNVIESVFITEV